eukprot:461495_1
MTVFLAVILCFVWMQQTLALSACDELDIIFIIDSYCILDAKALDNTQLYISNIIQKGSSEHSAFSVILYGDIPVDQKIQIVDLKDTASITYRPNEEKYILSRINAVSNAFDISTRQMSRWKHVPLYIALELASSQQIIQKTSVKKYKIGSGSNDKSMSFRDGNIIYFIFNHNHKLAHIYDTLCKFFDDVKRDKDRESVHLVLGQKFKEISLHSIQCKQQQIPATHFPLNAQEHIFERIYFKTCPALFHGKNDNHVALGSNCQWIDENTISKCHLKFDNGKYGDILHHESYLIAVDHFSDDMTFRIGDYLLSDPETAKELAKIGCTSPIYKIQNIKHIKSSPHHHVLKVFVSLPKSPTEYVITANAKGNIPIKTHHMHKFHNHKNPYFAHDDQDDNYFYDDQDDLYMEYDYQELVDNLLDELQDIITIQTHLYSTDVELYLNNFVIDEYDYEDQQLLSQLNDYYYDLFWNLFLDENHMDNQHYNELLNYIRMRRLDDEVNDNYIDDGAKSQIYETLQKIATQTANHATTMMVGNNEILSRRRLADNKQQQTHVRKVTGSLLFCLLFPHPFARILDPLVAPHIDNAIRAVGLGHIADSIDNFVAGATGKLQTAIESALGVNIGFTAHGKDIPLKIGDEDFTLANDCEFTIKVGSDNPYTFNFGVTEIIFTGNAIITLNVGYEFNMKLFLDYDFFWKFPDINDIRLYFNIHGQWKLTTYFDVTFSAELEINLNKLLYIGKTFPFAIGVVPIVVKPFVDIGGYMRMQPFSITVGVECRHEETFEVGYRYNLAADKNEGFRKRTIVEDKCENTWKIIDESDHGKCGLHLGFDLVLNAKIGVGFYEIVNVFLQMTLTMPVRINVPETDYLVCGVEDNLHIGCWIDGVIQNVQLQTGKDTNNNALNTGTFYTIQTVSVNFDLNLFNSQPAPHWKLQKTRHGIALRDSITLRYLNAGQTIPTLSDDLNPKYNKTLNWLFETAANGFKIKSIKSGGKQYLKSSPTGKITMDEHGSIWNFNNLNVVPDRNHYRTMTMKYDHAYGVAECSKACARSAEKFRYIGLQKPDQCWCSNSDIFRNNEPATDCDNGKGDGWAHDVYAINDQDRQLDRVVVRRYFNEVLKDHMYRSEDDPYKSEHKKHGYKSEEIEFSLPKTRENTVPLYESWNNKVNDHIYTIDETETNKNNYKYQQILGYCYKEASKPSDAIQTVPLYRFWNGKSDIKDHLYTTDKSSIGEKLQPGETGAYGYIFEGITCYVYGKSNNIGQVTLCNGGAGYVSIVYPLFLSVDLGVDTNLAAIWDSITKFTKKAATIESAIETAGDQLDIPTEKLEEASVIIKLVGPYQLFYGKQCLVLPDWAKDIAMKECCGFKAIGSSGRTATTIGERNRENKEKCSFSMGPKRKKKFRENRKAKREKKRNDQNNKNREEKGKKRDMPKCPATKNANRARGKAPRG